MKIQTLHIRNIASIEEATIDFDKGLLAAEPIFLICGETGSGKTTILNAICLALYKRVPYFDTVGDDEKGRPSAPKRNGSDNWLDRAIQLDQIKNPEQLLRRGTVVGEASLSFVGNDGHSYIATWEAHPNKQDKNKVKSTHRIYDSTARVTYSAVNEIKKVIAQAVGLNFDQFCRTTMLAQGQFSKFICAKDDEKEAILEKLTATERFSVYGAAIHDKYLAVKRQYDLMTALLSETRLLTAPEIEEINGNIARLRAEIQTDETNVKHFMAKIDWLTRQAAFMASFSAERDKLDMVQLRRSTPEYGAMISLVNDWESTAGVRADISRRDEDMRRLGNDEARLQAMNGTVARLLGALRALKRHADMLKSTSAACQTVVDSYSKHETMIEHGASLLRELDRLTISLQESKKLLDTASSLHDRLDKATAIRDAMEQKKEIVRKIAYENKESADKTAQKTKNDNLTEIDSKIKSLESRRDLLSRAKFNLCTINDYSEKAEAIREKISETDLNIRAENEHALDLARLLPGLEAQTARLEGEYQGKLDLKNAMAGVRRRFAETRECPLCGSSVEHLHTDEVIDAGIADSLEKAEKARADMNAAKSALAQTQGVLKALAKTRDSLTKDAETYAARLKEAHDMLNDSYSSCPRTVSEIEALIEQTDLERTDTISQRAMATDRINAHNAALRSLELANNDLNKAEKALLHASENVAICQNEIAAIDESIKKSVADIDNLKKFIINTATCSITDLSTPESCASTKSEILKVTKAYKKAVADREKVDAEIIKADNKIIICEKTTELIIDMFPDAVPVGDALIDNLDAALTQALQGASSLLGSIALTTQNIALSQSRISAYLQRPDSVNEQRLAQLTALPESDYSAARKSINDLTNAENRVKGALERLEKEIVAHAEKRPEMTDADTIDTLGAGMSNLREKISKNQELMAQHQHKLHDDNEKRQRLQEKLTEKEQLEQLRDRWLTLDRLYGGEKGVNFRRIAQIHVLANLLQRANYFLRDLDDRYRLTSSGMSLNIYVTDRHIDAAPRAVNSLSGGEGFLASLALALALSTISKERIDVDILFIDEGFGTLSPGPLDKAMATLRKLSGSGNRRVGIISHVEALRAVIPVKIQLERTTGSTSRLSITDR